MIPKVKEIALLANGKSLLDYKPDGMKTIGTNRIYLLLTPDYYVAVNPLVIKQFKDEINEMECKYKFISAGWTHLIKGSIPLPITQIRCFSKRPLQYVWEGGTVTYVALQVAYWLGARKVVIHGLDHYYEYEGSPNAESKMVGEDPNHFDPSYFKGKKWNNPDLELSEYAYRLARKVYEYAGREIINASTKTACDIFERSKSE